MILNSSLAVLVSCVLLAACATPPTVVPAASHAPATSVRVDYLHRENFTDVGDAFRTEGVRDANLEELRRHLVRRASPLLGPDQKLAVVITDVDMAGSYEMGRPGLSMVRIVRDVYPPRINLSFVLGGADDSVIKQGKRSLRDMTFMLAAGSYRNDALRYEKALIDAWLEKELRPAPL